MKYVLMLLVAVAVSCDRDKTPPPMGAGKVSLQDESTKVASPTGLAATWDGTESSPAMLLSWNPSSSTEGTTGEYSLRVKKSISSHYQTYSTSGSSYKVAGLEHGVSYEWGVQTEALTFQGYESSDWSSSSFIAQETVVNVVVEEEAVEEEVAVEEARSSESSEVSSQVVFIEDPNYQPGLSPVSGNDRSRCKQWEHWTGSECVDACTGTGQLSGRLGWDASFGRCRCDNENGYAYNPDNSRCELIDQPDEIPVESSPNCEGTAPRILNLAVGNHGSSSTVWGNPSRCSDHSCSRGEYCQVPEVSGSYPWSHTHQVCEDVTEGYTHRHNMGKETRGKKCSFSNTPDCSAYGEFCFTSWNHGAHDEDELFEDMTADHECQVVFQETHKHGNWSARVFSTSHAHPSGSYGTDWCRQGESAVCGGGTWSCGS